MHGLNYESNQIRNIFFVFSISSAQKNNTTIINNSKIAKKIKIIIC